MSSRGRRYDYDTSKKLNMKKVFAVIIFFLVIIMFIVTINKLLKPKEVSSRESCKDRVFSCFYK